VFSFINSFPDLHSVLIACAVAAALLPSVVITCLLIYATAVALSADQERGDRARLILIELLNALRSLFGCGRGGDR